MAALDDQPDLSAWTPDPELAYVDPAPDTAGKALEPNTLASALYESGLALKAAGQPAAAFKAISLAGRDPSGPIEAVLEAGNMLALARRFDEAIRWFALAARRAPQDPAPPYTLGSLFSELGREADAFRCFSRALQLDSGHTKSLRSLAVLYARRRRFDEAKTLLSRWETIAPRDPDPLVVASEILMEQGRLEPALDKARRAVALCSTAQTHLQLALILTKRDQHEEALREFARARDLDPALPRIRIETANGLRGLGRFAEARAELESVLVTDPNNASALLSLAEIHRFAPDDPLIARLEQLASTPKSMQDKISYHFVLGKAYDDIREPEAAIRQFHSAQELLRSFSAYDDMGTLKEVRRLADIFCHQTMQRLAGAGARSKMPIFILGMPRSGSTLVEQILSSHSDVAPGGEMNRFPRATYAAQSNLPPGPANYLSDLTPADITAIGKEYLAQLEPWSNGKPHVTDKLVSNVLLAGLIHLALPEAKIIHTIRDPLDTCFSIYSRYFGGVPYAQNLTWLGHFYALQSTLVQHWREVLPQGVMIDVRYEDVIADVEKEARRILAHCGLEWDERCLKFYEHKRTVQTASATQVRQPIYKSSIGRHVPYLPYLEPLITALQDPAYNTLRPAQK